MFAALSEWKGQDEKLETVTAVDEGGDELSTRPVKLPRSRRLSLLALVCVIFFTVSGGAYGLEPVVGAVGAGWAVVLVLLTPVVWSVPIALMVAELSSVMPEEGGYYVWVRQTLGDFWGAQEGWWTVCYTAVDMAIYPVLFVDYLGYFYPSLALSEEGSSSWNVWLARWLITVGLIVVGFIINLRGARAVGRNAIVNIVLVLLPFAMLVIFGLLHAGAPREALSIVSHDLSHNRNAGLLALGLSIVLWNYSGWDNVSTFAAEVKDPQRNYPRAIMLSLPLIIAAYLLPLLAGIAFTTDADIWSEDKGWPVIAELIGGHRLGVLLAAAALISAWSLFNSQLLYVSRLPYAMALDGWLPEPLARVSKRTGVPTGALLAACGVTAIFSALTFSKLIVIDIVLYSAGLSLEFIALLVLRRRAPDLPRLFRVPGGWPVLILLTLAPMTLAAIVLVASLQDESTDPRQALIICGVIISGVILYFARRSRVISLRQEVFKAREKAESAKNDAR